MKIRTFLMAFAALFVSCVLCAQDAALPKTLADLQKAVPGLVRDAEHSTNDDCFDWYKDPKTGDIYLVYVWGDEKTMASFMTDAQNEADFKELSGAPKDEVASIITKAKATVEKIQAAKGKATIFATWAKKGNKLHDNTEIMTIKPVARSKGKVKMAASLIVTDLRAGLDTATALETNDVVGKFIPANLYHDSLREGSNARNLPSFGQSFILLGKSTGIYDLCRQTFQDFPNTWMLGLGKVIMTLVGILLVYLAIVKGFEPLLLLPIGFGSILANIPLAGISGPSGLQGMVYNVGIESGVFPLIIFLGVGAMTDFGPMLANPRTALLGGAAQFGIFGALLGALLLNFIPGLEFNMKDAASIGIIGGADGPTAIFLASRLSPSLLGAIAVAAYSYMALVPIIQPPIMRALTTDAERRIKMKQLRHVPQIEKICFPIMITLLCALLLPDAAPLIGMLMLGNLMRECGVVGRLTDTASNALMNIVTIFLGLSVGSKLSADQFLNAQTLGILFLGCAAFCIATAAGVCFAKLMNMFSKDKINPLIGSAGVSAVPMAARVSNKVGLEYDPQNFLLMHAMGPNVSGVIGSAVAAGVLLCICGSI